MMMMTMVILIMMVLVRLAHLRPSKDGAYSLQRVDAEWQRQSADLFT